MLAVNLDSIPRIFLIGFVSYQTPWIHFPRNTAETILYVIKSGELHIEEEGTRYALRRGDLLVLEPNRNHVGVEKHCCDYYYIHFTHPALGPAGDVDYPALARGLLLEGEAALAAGNLCYFPKHYHIEDRLSFQRILNELADLLQLYRRKLYNRTLIALRFAEFLIGLSREMLAGELKKGSGREAKSAAKVHALLDHIHQNYTTAMTGREIEERFDCNYDYLNRVFQRLTGYSIGRYVNKVRIDRARELMEATRLPLGEIAYLTGFHDPYYFSKSFKKMMGYPPQEHDRLNKQVDQNQV